MELANVVAEIESGGTGPAKRKGLSDALARMGEGEADVLMVTRIDRIGVALGMFWVIGWLNERGRSFVALDVDWDSATPEGAVATRVFTRLADQALWERNKTRHPPWDGRNERIATYVPAGSTVLDVGAGAQTLRELLPDVAEYQACDLVDGPETLRCDFNQDIWPHVTKRYDIVIVSGVMEYLHEPRTFLSRLHSLGDRVLLTSVYRSDERRAKGPSWRTYLTRAELESLFEEVGVRWRFLESWQSHGIYELLAPQA